MKNLGTVLSRVFQIDANLEMQLSDVHSFGGGSDCCGAVVGAHDLITSNEIRKIEQETGMTWEEIEKEAEARLSGRWACFTILQEEVVGRILAKGLVR